MNKDEMVHDLLNSENWEFKDNFICTRCDKKQNEHFCSMSEGQICLHCAYKLLQTSIRELDLESLSKLRNFDLVLKFLNSKDNLLEKLYITKKINYIVNIHFEKESNILEILRCLIKNLGFVTDNPLSYFVRNESLSQIEFIGKDLDFRLTSNEILFKKRENVIADIVNDEIQETPWEFFVNCIIVLHKFSYYHYKPEKYAYRAFSHPNKNVVPFLAESLPLTVFERYQKIAATIKKARINNPSGDFDSDNFFKLRWYITANYNFKVLLKIQEKFINKCDVIFSDRPNKEEIAILLATILSTKKYFLEFITKLGNAQRELMLFLLQKAKTISLKKANKKFNLTIPEKEHLECLDDDLFLITINKYGIGNYLYIDNDLRMIMHSHLKEDDGCTISFASKIEADYIFTGGDDILDLAPFIYEFVMEEEMYSKSGNNLLKSSLKKLSKESGLKPFFDGTNSKNLLYIREKFIINFFSRERKMSKKPLILLKTIVNSLFNRKYLNDFPLLMLIPHIKFQFKPSGLSPLSWSQLEVLKNTILVLLKALSVNKWVSIEDVFSFAMENDLNFLVLSNSYVNHNAYIPLTDNSFDYHYEDKTFIDEILYYDGIEWAFIKGLAFFMASIGMLDLGYNESVYSHLLGDEVKHSMYDGLKFIRLTELGAYLLGRTAEYDFRPPSEEAPIILDERNLIAFFEGGDPRKVHFLNKIGIPTAMSGYNISYSSFLKECATKDQVKKRIDDFHRIVSDTPPKIWEDFFANSLLRIRPIKEVYGYRIFKLKESPDFVKIVANDNILKNYIIKAENFTILIKNKNFINVKNRLKELGYII